MKRRYFAYGSNLCHRQMAYRCPAAQPAETVCSLSGWRFIINRRGVATILPAPAFRVLGLIWHLTPDCEAALDEYEGVDLVSITAPSWRPGTRRHCSTSRPIRALVPRAHTISKELSVQLRCSNLIRPIAPNLPPGSEALCERVARRAGSG